MANLNLTRRYLLRPLLKGIAWILYGCIFVCCGCRDPCRNRCGTQRIRAEQQRAHASNVRAWREQRQKVEPMVLPCRRRALSSTASMKNTQKSLLLRLPLELRRQVLIEVLGNSVMHLIQLPMRLGHVRCDMSLTMFNGSRPNPCCDLLRECFGMDVPTYRHDECPHFPLIGGPHGCLSVLQTCHQLYFETIPLLYESNTFDFNHPQTLVFLARTLRPQRLDSIRCLQISWKVGPPSYLCFYDSTFLGGEWTAPDDKQTWESMWEIIAYQMNGLQQIKLRLEVGSPEPPRLPSTGHTQMSSDQEKLTARQRMDEITAAPKARVRRLKKFDLEFPTEYLTYDIGVTFEVPGWLLQIQTETQAEINSLCVN